MKTLSEYLDECGLLDNVLDGIDEIRWSDTHKEQAIDLLSIYHMNTIRTSVRVAGRYSPRKEEIQLHAEILKPGREKDRNETLLHEVGHLLTESVYKPKGHHTLTRLAGKQNNPHGKEWRYITSCIGGTPTTRHNYTYFTDLQIKTAKHEYTCVDCGEKMYTQRKLKNLHLRHHSLCINKENGGKLVHRIMR